MPKPVVLDGNTLEGGGQLVRVALALAALCGVAVRIHDIRGRRAPSGRGHGSAGGGRGRTSGGRGGRGGVGGGGGLKESHLAALLALQRWCGADVEGASVGSAEVVFVPRRRGLSADPDSHSRGREGGSGGGECIKLERPGSVWLVLQALLPVLVFGDLPDAMPAAGDAKDRRAEDAATTTTTTNDAADDGHEADDFVLTLHGGTNVSSSMSGEYVQLVLLPTLAKIGLPQLTVETVQRGWAGNAPCIGEVRVRIPRPRRRRAAGAVLPAFAVEQRGEIARVGISVLAGSAALRERVYAAAHSLATQSFGPAVAVEPDVLDLSGDERRLYVLLVATTASGWRLGRDYLWGGRACKTAAAVEAMVREASSVPVTLLRREVERGACVDEFMADQLVVFQALAGGRSVVDAGAGSGTLHARTVRWVCGEMLGVRSDGAGGCVGVGWGGEAESSERDGDGGVQGARHRLEGLDLQENAVGE